MKTSGNNNILLVEDNPDDAELILIALKKHNFTGQVYVARDGAEALQCLFDEAGACWNSGSGANVIFLDLKLPRMGGLEVLQKVKTDQRTQKIPVVVFTSSDEESDISESYRLGANSYLVKPVEFEKLIDAVGRMAQYWLSLNQN